MFGLEDPGSKCCSSAMVPGVKEVPLLGLVLSRGQGTMEKEFAVLNFVHWFNIDSCFIHND